jgi:hypothetical protein
MLAERDSRASRLFMQAWVHGDVLRDRRQRMRIVTVPKRWDMYEWDGKLCVPLWKRVFWNAVRKQRKPMRLIALSQRRDMHRGCC